MNGFLQFCNSARTRWIFSKSKQPACRLFSSSSTVPELPSCLLSFLKPPANLQVEHKFHSLQSPALPNSNCVDECFALWKLFFDVAKFPPLIALSRLSNYWNFAAILFCSRASPWRCSTVSWTRRSATPCGTTGSGGGRVADCTIPGAAAEAVEWRAADRPVPSAELADPAVAESERWAAGRLKKVRVPSPRAPGTISIIHWIKRTRVTGASMLTDFTRSKEQLKRFACLTRVLCELRPRVGWILHSWLFCFFWPPFCLLERKTIQQFPGPMRQSSPSQARRFHLRQRGDHRHQLPHGLQHQHPSEQHVRCNQR